ncbi:hypothetical protein [Pedobacter sp. L105]|uniref:hypothetical protein n=1 Tax=Pedobacter sp. L105 TaxID=1641871 RepID=UPI00131DF924|nr:hypothetical protein [Pedobacter sp. L105]
MKSISTKFFRTALLLPLVVGGFVANSQTITAAPTVTLAAADNQTKVTKTDAKKDSAATVLQFNKKKADPTDTAFKPVRRLWGYAFGDAYYKQHSDALNRGGSNQYTGIAANRNGMQMRRIYLGYDYDINKKFSVEALLAAEDNETTSIINGAPSTTTGDLLSDNKLTFYIKLLNLRIHDVWKGTDLVIGQVSTPAFPLLSEKIWAYRDIERTVTDIRRTPSYDLGATLQGTFDPDTKNYGYNIMVGNGTSAKPETDGNKWYYGDIWAKFLDKKIILDFYADYEKLTYNTATASSVSRNMFKGYVAYTTPVFTFGVEAFTNLLKNGASVVNAAKVKSQENETAQAISIYAHGRILKDKKSNNDILGYFVRYDNYNPDTKFDASHGTYTGLVSNYDPNTKENFFTGGLDWQPYKNIHFMPNVYYNGYTSNVPGVEKGHDLVYRATFFFQFGK